MQTKGPLSGFRVLEVGQLIAGPFCGTLLGYYGAEIIKVEPPGRGDPLRKWRMIDTNTGSSLWWHSFGRNKKCITLDLANPRAKPIIEQLAAKSDVLIENFRPGKMEEWKLGPEDLNKFNDNLIYCRLSGYGQSGPYGSKTGFASVCEAFGGFRHINGFPGGAPVRPNISLGDSLAALHAAFGVSLALVNRLKSKQEGGAGQVVDVAIYESMFNMMESIVPEFDRFGAERGPSGSTLTGIVPTNTYKCADGKYVVIGGNGDSIFKRLMKAADRKDMAEDPRFQDNTGRVQHQEEIDGAIEAWTQTLPAKEVVEKMDKAGVPAGLIYSVKDMLEDPQYQARGMFEEVDVGGQPLKVTLSTLLLN
jgi:crotonobetainyl-CoA:carnitine CoA-transferase CaiB-like acyl-CoA transferase